MSRQDQTKKILDKYLDEDFACFASGDAAPSKSALAALAKRLGVQFPDEFIQHSTSEWGGIYIEVKEEIWPRPKPYEVGPFWSFLYAMFIYGISAEIPDWMNLELAADEFRTDTGHQMVPFLKIVGDANVYCFDANGKIVCWDHETDEFEKIDKSFFNLFEDEVRELKARKEKRKSGRNHPS
jgi:hypothetical protein